MILILRGHIRSSFNSNRLYNFIKLLNENYNIDIYIHTWNIKQSNASWRSISEDLTIINEELIYNYFNDLKHLIKHIIIDDDTKIKLVGDLEGTICRSRCKKLHWKNYLYGQFRIIEYINENIVDQHIINTRFDIFENSNNFSEENILHFISKQDGNITKNIFIVNKLIGGIDNIFYGNKYTMYKLIKHMYFNLDEICSRHTKLLNQEYLFFGENNRIFADGA